MFLCTHFLPSQTTLGDQEIEKIWAKETVH